MKKEHPNTSTHSSNTVTTREKAIEWAKKVKLQITNSGYEKYSHCLTQDDLIEEMYKDYLFQEEAMRWWEMLGNKDKDSLQRDYGFNKNYLGMLPDEITHIYKSEHAIEAVDTNVLNPDNLDWDLYPGNEAGAFDHLDEPDYSPSIKEESSNREDIFNDMLSIVKQVKFWFDNEANYPLGTAGYKIAQEAKAILNRINNK